MALQNRVQTRAAGAEPPPEVLGDLRFRALLSRQDWARLPYAVRQRFSKRLGDGESAVYIGRVTEMFMSGLGRVMAQALRLMGAPLPVKCDVGVPSVVTVTEDARSGGQNWTRLYANRDGFPQTINSTKRFSGPTGLEEYIGFGLSMALEVQVRHQALVFRSAAYRLRLGTFCVGLPRWLSPGNLTVKHEEITPERFRFSLVLEHPSFGILLRQVGEYQEDMQCFGAS